jgi:hypothetical protein
MVEDEPSSILEQAVEAPKKKKNKHVQKGKNKNRH